MMRTLVDIPAEDLDLVNGVVKKLDISRAEFVRRAISSYLEPHRADPAAEAFGIWRSRPVDGLEYQERMRGEW
jgi:metal-responsive CopG/Arc/MetJ family transcriptional regulator